MVDELEKLMVRWSVSFIVCIRIRINEMRGLKRTAPGEH